MRRWQSACSAPCTSTLVMRMAPPATSQTCMGQTCQATPSGSSGNQQTYTASEWQQGSARHGCSCSSSTHTEVAATLASHCSSPPLHPLVFSRSLCLSDWHAQPLVTAAAAVVASQLAHPVPTLHVQLLVVSSSLAGLPACRDAVADIPLCLSCCALPCRLCPLTTRHSAGMVRVGAGRRPTGTLLRRPSRASVLAVAVAAAARTPAPTPGRSALQTWQTLLPRMASGRAALHPQVNVGGTRLGFGRSSLTATCCWTPLSCPQAVPFSPKRVCCQLTSSVLC